jgi:hypothetical protein
MLSIRETHRNTYLVVMQDRSPSIAYQLRENKAFLKRKILCLRLGTARAPYLQLESCTMVCEIFCIRIVDSLSNYPSDLDQKKALHMFLLHSNSDRGTFSNPGRLMVVSSS